MAQAWIAFVLNMACVGCALCLCTMSDKQLLLVFNCHVYDLVPHTITFMLSCSPCVSFPVEKPVVDMLEIDMGEKPEDVPSDVWLKVLALRRKKIKLEAEVSLSVHRTHSFSPFLLELGVFVFPHVLLCRALWCFSDCRCHCNSDRDEDPSSPARGGRQGQSGGEAETAGCQEGVRREERGSHPQHRSDHQMLAGTGVYGLRVCIPYVLSSVAAFCVVVYANVG